jgi:hypothetical protein
LKPTEINADLRSESIVKISQIILSCAVFLNLSACGFSVISPAAPMPFKTIKILGYTKPSIDDAEDEKGEKARKIIKKNRSQALQNEFVRKLVVNLEKRKNVQVVNEMLDAQVVVELHGPRIQSYASGYDSAGRVREERVEALLTVTLSNNIGRLTAEPEEIRISRYLTVVAGQPSIRSQDRKLTSEQLEDELFDRLMVKLSRYQTIVPQ